MATCQNEINSQLSIWISHVIELFSGVVFCRELIMILKIHLSKKILNKFKEWRFLYIFWNVIQWNLIRRKSVFLKSRFSCLRPCIYLYPLVLHRPIRHTAHMRKGFFLSFFKKLIARVSKNKVMCVYIKPHYDPSFMFFSNLVYLFYKVTYHIP